MADEELTCRVLLRVHQLSRKIDQDVRLDDVAAGLTDSTFEEVRRAGERLVAKGLLRLTAAHIGTQAILTSAGRAEAERLS